MTEGLFDFERADFGDLNLIPLCVRWSLDRCGTKISLKTWQALSESTREALAGEPPDSRSLGAWRRLLLESVAELGLEEPGNVPRWTDPENMPAVVADSCATRGILLDQVTWKSLEPRRRHALHKIASGKWRDQFLDAALREFGLH